MLLIAGVMLGLGAGRAEAQVLKTIRERASAKVNERVVKKAEDRLIETTGTVVDSVTEKTARGIDTVATRSGEKIGRAVDGTERAVVALAKGGNAEAELTRQLAAGRAVVSGITFTADGTIEPAATETIRHLARALTSTTGAFLIEGHVGPDAGASAQAMSEVHARAVKVQLVAEGVDASRLFVLGAGATRPPAPPGTAAARIEIVRMQ